MLLCCFEFQLPMLRNAVVQVPISEVTPYVKGISTSFRPNRVKTLLGSPYMECLKHQIVLSDCCGTYRTPVDDVRTRFMRKFAIIVGMPLSRRMKL